jgi:uncharacterized membrane protein
LTELIERLQDAALVRNGGTFVTEGGYDGGLPRVDTNSFERILKQFGPSEIKPDLFSNLMKFDFFFSSPEMKSFDLEKLTVFFIMYSSAPVQMKSSQLFNLLAEDVPQAIGGCTQMIVNRPEEPKIHRIFAYMAIITCLITIEVLRGQQTLNMSVDGLRELEEKYGMCSNQSILSNYTVFVRNTVLFRAFR